MRDGFLGVERPGRPSRDVLPERLDAIVRGLAFGKSMRWDDGGLRFSRPVRWLAARSSTRRRSLASSTRAFGHRFTHGRASRSRRPRLRGHAPRGRASSPTQRSGARQIVEGLDAIGGWSDPLGKLEEVIHLVERPHVLEGTLRRAVPRAARARRRDGDAVAPALLPARRQPLRLRRERRRPGPRPRRERERARGPARGRELHLRARRREGDRRARRAARAITFFAGAGTFADKTERLVDARRAARRR